MDIVKKNLVSIIFGVIAIIAVAADFYPMGGKREDLKREATERAAKAETLKGLLTKPRKMPSVDLSSNEPPPLTRFPNQPTVDAAHEATKKVADAATNLEKTVIDKNRHTPLVPGSLPGTAGDTFAAGNFARAYAQMFPPPPQQGNAGVAPTTMPITGLLKILEAGIPPSNETLSAESAKRQAEIISEREVRGAGGNVVNQQEVQQAVIEGLRSLTDDLRTKMAKQCKCYVNPDPGLTFSMYPNLTATSVPGPTTIFWAQVGLWAQEDICQAIHDINAKSANVMEAPVKQVVKVSFVLPGQQGQQNQQNNPPVFVLPGLTNQANAVEEFTTAAPTGEQPTEGGTPPAPPMDPSAAPTKNIGLSPTGRQCSGLFDVLQFQVELVVDAAKVPQVLEGLGAGRYITVLNVENVETVDSALMRGAGFYFGPKPCVKIRVLCEELFFRAWLQELVPDRLKKQLGYQPPTPAAPPAGA